MFNVQSFGRFQPVNTIRFGAEVPQDDTEAFANEDAHQRGHKGPTKWVQEGNRRGQEIRNSTGNGKARNKGK
ncbi:MAG: hypothetical protein AB7P76_12210 [Candidatus Melainabacteria bacterium]